MPVPVPLPGRASPPSATSGGGAGRLPGPPAAFPPVPGSGPVPAPVGGTVPQGAAAASTSGPVQASGSVRTPHPVRPPGPAPTPGPAPATSPVLQQILRGPSGLGTTGLYLPPLQAPTGPTGQSGPSASAEPAEPAAGRPVPGLYHHPIPEPDAHRVEEVSRRIKAWAVEEVELFPPDWEDQFDGFSLGRYMVACHPDAPTVEHLMIATRLMAAENALDDCYCEDHGGSPVGLGGRLLLAHTALDPLHTTAEYQPDWAESLHADAPRRAYRSAMQYFVQQAGHSQADRYRHDMARLHLGYLAEAAWAETDHVPEVWEYLAMRQFNNFRPCPTITDTVGGYELPADLHALPAMQRVIALAGNATTIVNDLYSYTKELAGPGRHLNLPVVIAEREDCSVREAYLKAVEVHNDLMHAFEAAAADLAAEVPHPVVLRFLRGVAAWVDGNHYWHQTNTYRYSLPDFW
ncbi:family 2 encapsulin nanocompartment cargo protein terpene cyclase [Kitasatospora sp. NPDC093679]|uniref:family 2 encapsulin nanocompartment cargo protein terpene cyclase n=1 Tax=Kitasatospora sp. NPDC093679 TaxID=3154983 RepID=UPI0034167FBE